jgi:NADPH-dependent glutamate synthase beta subunit-like oxidoreductase
MSVKSFYLDGREIPFRPPALAGAQLLTSFGAKVKIPGPEEHPYLFCGNGSCRDCNLMVDGFPDLPACRIPLAPGMSLRSGEGAGEENALSRHLGKTAEGLPLACDVLVVGAGHAGRAASDEARRAGAHTILVDARGKRSQNVRAPCPARVVAGRLSVFEGGLECPVRVGAVVLANGARDESPNFPGATLFGVLPLDLLARYDALGYELPGSVRTARTKDELESVSGSIRVERARIPGRGTEVPVDFVFVGIRRAPELSLAKALGCRTLYDRELSVERLVAGESGETSVPGVFAAGDVVKTGSLDDATESGLRAGRAAARFALRSP